VTRPRYELPVLAAIVVAYLVSFGRSCDDGYVWDDVPEIARSAALERPLADGLRLTQVERSDANLDTPALQLGYDSYRPVAFASEWLDVALWGRDAGALHRTNVALGALAIALAYLAARRWLRSPRALIAVAVFALHPAQIEAVAYLSARADLLAGVFALASLYAALRVADAARGGAAVGWAIAAAVALALAMLSKESAVGVPVAVAAIAWGRAPRRRALALVGALVAVVAGCWLLRGAVVATHASPPYAAALADAAGVLVEDLRVVALPFDLSIARAADHHVALGWLAAAAVLAIAVRARPRPAAPWLGGLVWAVVLVAPSIVAVETLDVVADRYLYAAMFGVGVVIAEALGAAAVRPALRRWAIIAAAGWGALLVVVGWIQVPVWHDMRALYEHAAALAPDSASAQYRVAYLDVEDGRWDLAVPRLEHAIELDPREVSALNNLGVWHLREGRPTLAQLLFARAIASNPAHFRSWLNLGLAEIAQGEREAGCAYVRRSLEILPSYAAAREADAAYCRAHAR
jgi:tetratricopeptide (TPR) repeat protein